MKGKRNQWMEIREKISQYYGEWTDLQELDGHAMLSEEEGSRMPSTALLGNGDLGAASVFCKGAKGFLLSKGDFWSAGDMKGDYEANEGGRNVKSTKPIAIGGVAIYPQSSDFQCSGVHDFYEKHSLVNAEVSTTMAWENKSLRMETFISATSNLLVTKLSNSGSDSLELIIRTWAKSDEILYPVSESTNNQWVAVTRQTVNLAQENPKSWISEVAMMTKILGGEVLSVNMEKGLGEQWVTVEPDQEIWIVTTIAGGGKTYNWKGKLQKEAPVQEGIRLLEQFNQPYKIKKLKDEHRIWWKDYWSQSHISIAGDDSMLKIIERYYFGAQYLLGCTCRKGKTAPGLYGVWRTNDAPGWSGDYHLNYNFISPFYGAASSNHVDMLYPLIQAVLDYEEEGVARASDPSELLRLNPEYVTRRLREGTLNTENLERAVLYPMGIGPWGSTTDDIYLNETLMAGYCAFLMVQYYQYTLEESFLLTAYEYVKKCLAFYEEWIEKDGKVCCIRGGFNEGSWALNPTIELGAVRALLDIGIQWSRQLDVDSVHCEKWQQLLDGLPIFASSKIEEKEMLLLASDVEDYTLCGHNVVALDTIVPCEQIGRFSSKKDCEMVFNTLKVYGSEVWRNPNNFPRVFTDAIRTRYPVNEVIQEMHQTLVNQMQKNMWVDDGVHGIEKIGATEAVNNMLLASEQGIVQVFPNWLENKTAKFSNLRAKGAFLISSEYDGMSNEILFIRIHSEAGGTITLLNPWSDQVVVTDINGEEVKTQEGRVAHYPREHTLQFSTLVGNIYIIQKKEGNKHEL